MRAQLVSRLATALFAALLLALPAPALAQATGSIGGTVVGPDGQIVSGARVAVEGTSIGALTSAQGNFLIRGVPIGTHTLRVTHLGYGERTVEGVVVTSDATADVQIELTTAAIDVGGVVVSASRQAERITDAPATVTRIDASELAMSVGNSFSGALKEVQGLDYIQVGATSAAINARGFNSSFNNRMLMLIDNRISVLPESGLPIGIFTTVPKMDLASAEVIVGPGAALYGADATNGVLSLQTKDPLQYPGTTVELSAGLLEKDGDDLGGYTDVQFRHAGVADGTWGYKVSGEFQQADDWSNTVSYGADGTLPELGADFNSQVIRGEGALVYYGGLNKLELSAGMSQNNGVGQTNVGRNQFIDWTYNFVQLQGSTPHWYVNVYRNQSQSGESYALNRFTENRASPAFDDMTDAEVRKESDWPSNGRLYAAEVQNNFAIGELTGTEGTPLADTEVVWGGQARMDLVSSDREWLTDRFDDEDVQIKTGGIYAQTRTPLHEKLDVILAARYDAHDNYESQFSPKAGLVVKPAPDHAVRVTYNKAFKSPTILQTNFWIPNFTTIPAFGVGVGVFGNTQGFTVRHADETVTVHEPLVPEENTTIELGYKGVLADKLFLDVTGYRAEYTNFFSPLVIIGNPLAGDVVSFGDGTEPIASPDGMEQIVLTYFNLGDATILGTDMAARYRVSDHFSARATLSLIELDSRNTGTADDVGEEATSLNAPSTKWTLGASVQDLGRISGGATLRHVTGYAFHSGINQGKIPTFNTVDVTAAYDLERFGSQLMLNVTNLFGCRSADPAIVGDDGECGFGTRHREMVNMPMIGTMVFLGIRYQR